MNYYLFPRFLCCIILNLVNNNTQRQKETVYNNIFVHNEKNEINRPYEAFSLTFFLMQIFILLNRFLRMKIVLLIFGVMRRKHHCIGKEIEKKKKSQLNEIHSLNHRSLIKFWESFQGDKIQTKLTIPVFCLNHSIK